LIYFLFIVGGVIFSIVKSILKGKNIDLDTIFQPPQPDVAANSDENDKEPVMVVDAQGNIIEIKQTKQLSQLPPMHLPPQQLHTQPTMQTVAQKPTRPKKRSTRKPTAAQRQPVKKNHSNPVTEHCSNNNYVDFIRNNAASAVIMHEILDKPKALQ